MRTSESDLDGTPVVHLEGDLDHASAGALERALSQAASRGGNRVVADLSGVEYLDSACLGTLIKVQKHLMRSGGSVAISGCGEDVARIMRITVVCSVVPIFEDAASAAEHLASVAQTQGRLTAD